MKNWKMYVHITLLGCLLLLSVSGCAALSPFIPQFNSQLPPILAQDEVSRSYVKLGRIVITREVYIFDGLITSDVREWGFEAIRREAAKMGADAVVFPEVSGAHTMTSVLPATEYRATGIAIKFK